MEDLEDLYETAPCGYVSIRPDGRIAKANATFAAWTGYAGDALVGRKLYDLLSVGQRLFYETHFAPLLRMQGNVSEIAMEIVTATRDKLPVLVNAAEKRDTEGRHLFTRLTFLKAVDRRLYERELVAAREAAEAASRAQTAEAQLREQFIAVLGHDLRNPLASVLAGIRMLMQRETLSDRGAQVLTLMGGSVGRASALIDDLLDLARGRLGGGIAISRDAPQPLAPVLEQVIAEIRSAAPGRDIVADIALDEPVLCDAVRIGQLLSNLLGNAVAHGAQEEPIRVSARTGGDGLEISVANGGPPIPAAAMERLFHPFFRGEANSNRQGLGLGLFIASEIARAHGATLSATSDHGETRFSFWLPAGEQTPARAPAQE